MSLRIKALLWTSVVVAALVGGLFGTLRLLVVEGFREAETEAAKQRAQDVRGLVETLAGEAA